MNTQSNLSQPENQQFSWRHLKGESYETNITDYAFGDGISGIARFM
jgi:hypothetical protein